MKFHIKKKLMKENKKNNYSKQTKHYKKNISEDSVKRKTHSKLLISFFQKAGYDIEINFFEKRLFNLSIGITGLLWFLVYMFFLMNKGLTKELFIYSAIHWTFIFAFVWLLLRGMVYFWLEFRIYNRTKEVELVLPDFLQLTSSNISAGMPIDRALWFAIRPNFGILANEIEVVAKETLSGEDLTVSLQRFVNKYDSVVLKRSIALLLEGLDAGGELADLLNKIALNLQELKIMKKEMSANVTTYAIFITFASIIIAPVLFALSSQLVKIIISITSSLHLSGNGPLSFSPSTDFRIIDRFKTYSYMMLMVTSLMSALIIGVIKKGNVKESVKNIPIYIIISLIIFWLVFRGLGSVFSGFF